MTPAAWFPDFWNRLGGRDAISWVTFVVFITLQITGPFASAEKSFEGRETELFLILILTAIPVAATLGFGWLILHRAPLGKPRPILTLLIFEAAIVVRAIVLDDSLIRANFTDEPNVGYRILASHTSMLLGWALAAYFVSLSRDFARSTTVLADTRDQLLTLSRDASRRLDERRTELVQDIRQEISLRLEQSAQMPNLHPNTLRHILDDVVRPISHDLAERGDSFEFDSVSPTPRGIRWTEVFLSALMANPIRPIAFAYWMAWTTSQLFVMVYGPMGWSLAGASVVIALLTLTLARMGWNRIPKSWGLIPRSTLLTLIFISISVFMLVANHLSLGMPLRGSPVIVASALHVIVFGWVIALVTSIGTTLRSVTIDLENSTGELRREVVLLNATYRQMTSEIARVLHGPVQDAVSVGLQKITSPKTLEKDQSEIARVISESIQKSLLLMSEPTVTARSLELSLSELVELWEGVVELSIHLDDGIAKASQADNRATSTIFEIVREATSNAVRHGSASWVNASVSLEDSNKAALVVVTNDGSPLDEQTPTGIGTRQLEELTLWWSREQSGAVVELKALVPLDAKVLRESISD